MSRDWWRICGLGLLPRSIRVFAGATLVIGRTPADAQALLAEYRAHSSVEGALAHASASLGIDFARYGWDETSRRVTDRGDPVQHRGDDPATRPGLDQAHAGGPVRARQPAAADRVGSASEVADALQAWVAEADVDGFNLSRTVAPECWEAAVDLLVPELQARGVYKTSYAAGTYREKLFGAGPRLQPPHPAGSGLP